MITKEAEWATAWESKMGQVRKATEELVEEPTRDQF